MQITKNFRLEEFIESRFYTKEQQKQVWVSYYANENQLLKNIIKLAFNLQTLRDELKQPIHINIAYRPEWYEALKGRSGFSQHCLAKAADIRVDGYTPAEVAETIERLILEGEMLQGGLKGYETFTHYDVRKKRARW